MTGFGSGDVAREEEGPPLDDADAAPPDMRKGTHERLGASTGVAFGAGTGSGGESRRARESRCRLDAWESATGSVTGRRMHLV